MTLEAVDLAAVSFGRPPAAAGPMSIGPHRLRVTCRRRCLLRGQIFVEPERLGRRTAPDAGGQYLENAHAPIHRDGDHRARPECLAGFVDARAIDADLAGGDEAGSESASLRDTGKP